MRENATMYYYFDPLAFKTSVCFKKCWPKRSTIIINTEIFQMKTLKFFSFIFLFYSTVEKMSTVLITDTNASTF